MTEQEQSDGGAEPTRVQSPVERLCSEFAENWHSGGRPDLDSFLQRLRPEERSEALIKLVLIEVQARRERGEEASEEEYRQRYPEASEAISRAFTTRGQAGLNTQSELEWSVTTPGLESLVRTQIDRAQLGPTQRDLSQHEQPRVQRVPRGVEVEDPSPWRAGTKLGCYQLEEFLARGGFGEVWKGRDTLLHRPVAIKLLRPNHLNTPHHKSFFEDGQKLEVLRKYGARVLEVLTAGESAGWPYLVTRYLPGGTLERRIRERPRDWREACRVVAELAETLGLTHAQQIYHRDIKPANVLLDEKEQVYLADFGLATSEEQQVREGPTTGGTWCYKAPEQGVAAAGITGGRTDIYALGVVLYEWLTGRRPGLADRVLHEQWLADPELRTQPPRELNGEVPEEVQAVCLAMLEKDYTKRNITAGDVARRLRSAVEPAVPTQPQPSVPPQLQPSVPPRRNRWIAAGVVALGFLGLSGVGVWSLSRGVQDDDKRAVGGRDRWIKTSGVTPEVERHVGIRGTESVVFDVEGERLILNTDELRLLEFVTESKTIPGRIEMTIDRTRLDGLGLYYQKQEVFEQNNTKTQFRGLMFREVPQPDGVKLVLTSNTYSIHPLTGSMEGQHAVGESPIPSQVVARRPFRLAVNIEKGYIQSVELDGKKLDVPDLEHPTRARFVPPFGVFIKSGDLHLFPPRVVYP